MKIRTHAKVNLFLHVMGLRRDRYHEIETILHGVNLADDLSITPLDEPRIEVDMVLDEDVVGDIPQLEDNLVYLAARALVENGAKDRGVHIDLLKRIPMAAGLGGGSGNAAGILVILNEMWGLSLDKGIVADLAGRIGSDVPYCIAGGTALAKARGEKLTRLPGPDDLWFVLGISNEPLKTRDVYQAWDDLGEPREASSAPMTMALGGGNPTEIASLLHNDLEPIALQMRPELHAKKDALAAAGALGAAVSGSGPTLFGIASGESHAVRIAAAVEDVFDRVMVVRSQPECIERLD
ncbi:MAG TPA: 4-(cytidine 5'-diphospho)-2-C-methyl-D-erythritol kinase [Actinomycetota bacterium]|nr:4-(cytidine 5'-diphospho)-2-C-methyl-D-erythritol kinase [Actinomycetota bacterium]